MGSKTIIFFGLLISAAYLYFSVLNHKIMPVTENSMAEHLTEQNIDNTGLKQVEVTKEEEKVVVEEKEKEGTSNKVVEEVAAVTKSVETTVEKNTELNNTTQKEISTPAFGFMSSNNKKQIVGLMSYNDKGGILSKKIEELCKKYECSKDMRFEKDILDASWQDQSVKIINLLTSDSIENGSIFIEENTLKLEGDIKDIRTQNELKKILDAVKSDKFKVENYTKLSDSAKKEQNKKKAGVKETKHETKVEVKAKENKPVVSHAKVKKEIVVKKPKKTIVKHEQIESNKDMVATPVMETTISAEERVRKILSEIKGSTNQPEVGVVAKSHMETTVE